VINTFFLSLPLMIVVNPAGVGPGAAFSDVKDGASLLLRTLERPREPSPA
jgi:hypothetical protein